MEVEVSFRLSINVFKQLRKKGASFKRKVGDKILKHDGSGFKLTDKPKFAGKSPKQGDRFSSSKSYKSGGKSRGYSGSGGYNPGRWSSSGPDTSPNLPGYREEDRDMSPRKEWWKKDGSINNIGDGSKRIRHQTYEGQSGTKIANRATDNPYIMGDILSDPGLVGADSETEAVAKIASENPGWAKMSDLVSTYDIDVDADGNLDVPGQGEEAGEVEAEAGNPDVSGDAGSGNGRGGITTADPGDLGPSTPADYGMDVGSDSGAGESASLGDTGVGEAGAKGGGHGDFGGDAGFGTDVGGDFGGDAGFGTDVGGDFGGDAGADLSAATGDAGSSSGGGDGGNGSVGSSGSGIGGDVGGGDL